LVNQSKFARIEDIVNEINIWDEARNRTGVQRKHDSPSATVLIEGVRDVERLSSGGVFAQPELSPYRSLRHDDAMRFFATPDNLGESINRHAEYYFGQTEFTSSSLDWLYVNLLVAYSYERYKTTAERLTGEVIGGMFHRATIEYVEGRRLWSVALLGSGLVVTSVKVLLVTLPFFLVDGDFFLPSVYVACATLAFAIFKTHRLETIFLSRKRAVFEQLAEFRRVQLLIATTRIRWDILQAELRHPAMREAGWLPALLDAVTVRSRSMRLRREP
jgi:hypothetical protein